MAKQIKIIIAEDEAPLRNSLRQQIKQLWPEIEIAATCADGETALEACKMYEPDAVFLDIRMPGISGLEVAREVSGNAFVVFITAYDEYAVSAFESGALDYLLKPIETPRLTKAIERLQRRLNDQKPQSLAPLIDQLRAQLEEKESTLRWITASVGDTVKMIPVDEIVYFQSEHKYTKVVTADQHAVIRLPLKTLIKRLDGHSFWQVHRSVIVAAKAVNAIKKNQLGSWELTLHNRTERLPVSSGFQRRFKGM